MKRIYINFFMAGSNSQGSTFSKTISVMAFENKINFKIIRNNLKALVLEAIKYGSTCIKDTYVFYNLIIVDDNEKDTFGYSNGKVKTTNILEWKTK